MNDYIKKLWINFLKNKKDFYNWFIHIVSRLKRLTEQKLVHFKVDEKKEYINHVLLR